MTDAILSATSLVVRIFRRLLCCCARVCAKESIDSSSTDEAASHHGTPPEAQLAYTAETGEGDLTERGRQLALQSLGNFVKGGKYQFLAELAQISVDDYMAVGDRLYALPYVHEKRIRYHAAWDGLPLLDAFEQDDDKAKWGGREYWAEEMAADRLRTRQGALREGDSFRWKVGESVWHTRHAHEPPIGAEPIAVVHKCARYVALCKPPSMPVHPSGHYKRASLIFLVAARLGLRRLFVVHRIDKVTSGLVVFGRTREAAAELHAKNKAHLLEKTYLAEVEGNFPNNVVACHEPLAFGTKAKVDHGSGKPASTSFRKLRYLKETNTTLLEVKPKSGRQHQIRCHLQFLNFPIVGDPIYGNGEPSSLPPEEHNLYCVEVPNALDILDDGKRLKCKHCPKLFMDGIRSNAGSIRLHALRYAGDNFSYETEPPAWAEAARGLF